MKKNLLFAFLVCAFGFSQAQTNVSSGGTVVTDIHVQDNHPASKLIDGDESSIYEVVRLEDASWRIYLPKPANVTSLEYMQGWPDWTQAQEVKFTIASGESITTTLAARTWTVAKGTVDFNFTSPTSFVDVHVLTATDGTGGADYRYGGFCEMTVFGTVTSNSDTKAPVISNVQVDRTSDNSAVVTWDTDEAATSMIKYSTTGELIKTTNVNQTLKTSHSVTINESNKLNGIIEIWCADANGNGIPVWNHGFSTVKTHYQYGVGDLWQKDDNGDDVEVKDMLTADGLHSDFVQSWCGEHDWQSDNTKDWRNWLTSTMIKEHVEAGYDFQLLHFFLGDYATQTLLSQKKTALINDLKDLAQLIKNSGHEDRVLLTLQPDWNQPDGDLADWDGFNDFLIECMDAIRAIAPDTKIGLIAGNWDFYQYIPISMSRAALEADYFSFQEMVVSTKKDISVAGTVVERAERFIRFLRTRFMKPVRWDYLLVSDYGGSNWEQAQVDAVNDFFANKEVLRDAGLTATCWMAYQDTPGATGYYGEGEAHKGLKYGDNTEKPIFSIWKTNVAADVANRGTIDDSHGAIMVSVESLSNDVEDNISIYQTGNTLIVKSDKNLDTDLFSVYDMTGKSCKIGVSSSSTYIYQLNVSGLTSGIYVVYMQTEDGKSIAKKVLIQ